MPKKITTEDFIMKSKTVHGNYYNYSNVVYINMHTKVNIIDPIFGEFLQTPMGHLQGQGHPKSGKIKSANKRRKTITEFIESAINKHGNLYDYSKVDYVHCDKKVCIVDPEFGEFWQTPYQHLNSHGCPKRTKNKKWTIHYDHIIPMSIINSPHKKFNEWVKERPLYKFLNSDINLTPVSAKFNIDKNDTITINNKTVSASSIRNNYDIISKLIKDNLGVDPTNIISEDKNYVSNYFHLI